MNRNARVLYSGPKFSLERRRCELPDGRVIDKDLIVHNGAAVILPFVSAADVLLVKQWRPTVGDWLLEAPAGTLEKGEDPKVCAKRELEEECGFRAGRMTKLCTFFASPGVMTERMHVFVARGLKPTRQNLDEHEIIRVVRVPFAEAIRMVEQGRIRDAKTITTLLMYRLKNP